MKLKDLKEILKSPEGDVTFGVLYNQAQHETLDEGSVDYLIQKYGESDVVRIYASSDLLIIAI